MDKMLTAVGVVLLVASSQPWGIAEGLILRMDRYNLFGLMVVFALIFLAFSMYFVGFLLWRPDFALAAVVWEVFSLPVAYLTKARQIEFTTEVCYLLVMLLAGAIIMGFSGHMLAERLP